MRLIDVTFPLIVAVNPRTYGASDVDQMIAGFEAYFARGERYSVLTYVAANCELPRPRERKRITEWASRKDVTEHSARLCVASAVVLESSIARGMMTALLWFWKPASPFTLLPNPREGVDWCFDRLERAHVGVPDRAWAHELLRREVWFRRDAT